MKERRKKTAFITIALVLAVSTSPLLYSEKSVTELPGTGDYVVLLHGLGRESASMNTMARFLGSRGFHVINIDYPSRDHDIAALVDRFITPAIDKHCTIKSKKIHFVTHSLGGILVRFYLKKKMSPRIGRAVMLAPPSRGSEIADFLKKFSPVRRLMGPALSQLGTDGESVPLSLGPPPCETGVITGNVSFNWINSFVIPGPDDGKVSIKRARLNGMKEFMVVKRSHVFIMKAPEVMKATASFLIRGNFKEK